MIKIQVSRPPQTGSSIYLMTHWVGERPHKNSRSRRGNVVSPVSRNVEAQVSSEGCPASDFSHKDSSVVNRGYQLATSIDKSTQKYKRPTDDTLLLGLSESEVNCDFALAAKKDASSNLKIRKNKIPTNDFGDCMLRQRRTGKNLSLTKPGLPSGRKKSENILMAKPLQNMRPNDTSKTKYGCPPLKKQRDCKALTHVGQTRNNGSSDFTGEYDDNCEELCQAAKSAHDVSNLACSGPFWEKMDSIFATISEENESFLKQQINIAEELDKTLSQMLGIDHKRGDIMNNEATHGSEERQRSCCDGKGAKIDALIGKYNVERLDKVTPLFKRLLSAIIPEDESEELYLLSESKATSQKCASDDSQYDSSNQFDFEPRDLDRMNFKVESEADLQIQKNCLLDKLSCDRSIASSNTFREICSNDLDQLQPAELSGGGFPSLDIHYQLMSLDERLRLELQSIGLYPEVLPDLAEEDEAKNKDVEELKEAKCQQVCTAMIGRKKNLDTIDRATRKGRDTERQKVVQVVFDQLIEMAYRKILACMGSKNSRHAGLKVSKQVALCFVKRALGSCKIYEETGNSCFSEPDLRHIIFSSPCENVAKSADYIVSETANNTCNKVSDPEGASESGAVSSAYEKYDSRIDDNVDKGLPDSLRGSIHLSEQGSFRIRPLFMKEILVNGGGGGSSPTASNLNGLVNAGVKGKRSRRGRNHSMGQSGHNSISRVGWQSLDSEQNESKRKTKPKQKCNSWGYKDTFMEAKEPASLSIPISSQSVDNAGNNGRDRATFCGSLDISKVKPSTESGNLQRPQLDSIEELGLPNDLDEHQDLGCWLNIDEDGLKDHDLMGLEIPMDDLSEIM